MLTIIFIYLHFSYVYPQSLTKAILFTSNPRKMVYIYQVISRSMCNASKFWSSQRFCNNWLAISIIKNPFKISVIYRLGLFITAFNCCESCQLIIDSSGWWEIACLIYLFIFIQIQATCRGYRNRNSYFCWRWPIRQLLFEHFEKNMIFADRSTLILLQLRNLIQMS